MTAAECAKYSVKAVCTGGTLNGLSYTLTGIEALNAPDGIAPSFFYFPAAAWTGTGFTRVRPKCAP